MSSEGATATAGAQLLLPSVRLASRSGLTTQEHPESQLQPGREQSLRTLLVEDDDAIRIAVEITLEREGQLVRSESNGALVREIAKEFAPDMAILDVRFPVGPNGYAIARMLRASSNVPILFLTACDSLEDRLAGFEAGADDYLVKPFSMAELVARVRALLRRCGREASIVRQVGDVVIDDGARVVLRGGWRVDLTETEFQLLTALAKCPGVVLSKIRLLKQVWGYESYDVNVVEVHICALRRKLEQHGPRVLHTVRGVGYVMRAD